MPRLVVAHASQPENLRRVEATLERRTGLTARLRGQNTVVMADANPDVPLHDGRGGVFGELFGRAELRRIRVLSPVAAEAIVASGGQTLVSDFWGDYLGVVLAPDGAMQIVRGPFGALSAYQFKVEGVEIVTTDVGLLIDAGWLTPRINWGFVAHALAFPFQRSERTGFEGLTEMPPGSQLRLSPGGQTQTRKLWSPWDHVQPRFEDRLAGRLKEVIQRCVRAWADGRQRLVLELSGGLDSSILAACLWDVPADVVCVNMVSPARDGDERLFARAVAERKGLVLQEIELEPRGLDLTAPPALRRPRPGAHALLGPWDEALIARAQDLGADAFVSGGGGDNVFFNTHGTGPAADALRRAELGIWATAVKDLAASHGCSVWRAGGLSLRRATRRSRPAWQPDLRFLAPGAAPSAPEPHPWLDRPAHALPGKLDHVKGLMAVQNYLDCFPRSAQAPILTPLLSQPIVELCLSIPSWEWIREGQDRSLAREAFRGALPDFVLDRRSKGNLAGYAGPAFEAAREKLAGHLLGGRLDQAGLLDAPALRAALDEVGPPKGSDYFRILQIADVESWARRWS